MMRPLVLALVLAGCVDSRARHPSLAPRAAETRAEEGPVIEHAPSALTIAAEPELHARLTALGAALDKAVGNFSAEHARARKLIGNGAGAVGSDGWLDSQVILGGLDRARSEVSSVLADLDQLAVMRAEQGLPAFSELETMRKTVRARLREIDRAIEQLGGLARTQG